MGLCCNVKNYLMRGQLYKTQVKPPVIEPGKDPTGKPVFLHKGGTPAGIIIRFWPETQTILVLTHEPVDLPPDAERLLCVCDFSQVISEEVGPSAKNPILKSMISCSQ
jgi:hypothetical protein